MVCQVGYSHFCATQHLCCITLCPNWPTTQLAHGRSTKEKNPTRTEPFGWPLMVILSEEWRTHRLLSKGTCYRGWCSMISSPRRCSRKTNAARRVSNALKKMRMGSAVQNRNTLLKVGVKGEQGGDNGAIHQDSKQDIHRPRGHDFGSSHPKGEILSTKPQIPNMRKFRFGILTLSSRRLARKLDRRSLSCSQCSATF